MKDISSSLRKSLKGLFQLIRFTSHDWCSGHGFIGYPKGRNVERALGFSLTGTVSTSPNLAKARARRARNDCRATRSLFS